MSAEKIDCKSCGEKCDPPPPDVEPIQALFWLCDVCADFCVLPKGEPTHEPRNAR